MEPISAWIAAQGIGGLASAFGNYTANRENRRFQERMSNTAHQREVKDLLAAGLNPALSAKIGGASTPAGSSVGLNNPMAGMADSSAKQSELNYMKRKQNAEIMTLNSQMVKNMADAEVSSAVQEEAWQRYANLIQQWQREDVAKRKGTWEAEAQARIDSAKMPGLGLASAKADEQMWKRFGELGKEYKMLLPLLNVLKMFIGRGGTQYVPSYQWKGY